jgi:hypothetical protein
VGALLTFVSVVYSSIRTSSKTQLGKLGMADGQGQESVYLMDTEAGYDSDEEGKGGQKVRPALVVRKPDGARG